MRSCDEGEEVQFRRLDSEWTSPTHHEDRDHEDVEAGEERGSSAETETPEEGGAKEGEHGRDEVSFGAEEHGSADMKRTIMAR